jgi:tetratricopeptide (TPR) repeat protein
VSDALATEAQAIATATGRSDLRALMLARQARQIANMGAVDAALDSLGEARTLFLLQGRTREAWETSLVVASLRVRTGAWDAAIAICDDELLPTAREVLRDDRLAARALEEKAVVLQFRGRLDEALQIRRAQLAVFERRGDVRHSVAVQGKIADIHQDRGDLAEALRIRTEVQLPAHAQLGDRRERAITLGKIADVLVKLGDADEALRLRMEEVVPVFRALGELRGLAVTLGKVTDTLITHGEHDEALRLLREQVLPALTQIDARRDIAVTHARIGAILVMKGGTAEAITHLEVAREEFDHLGDVHEQISARVWLAKALWGAGNTVGALRESQAALSLAEARREPHWLSEAARDSISLLLALHRPQEADATYERVSVLLAEDGRWNALDSLAPVKARVDHALATPHSPSKRRRS